MSQVNSFEYTQKRINVKDLRLDLENPRFNDKLIDRGLKKWSEKILQDIIEHDGIIDILDSIRKRGVIDPIWVVENKKNKYDVIEGSRRIVVLRGLLQEDARPPKGIKYDKVMANILSKNISKKEIDAKRVILQTGKKDWGPYNVASAIHNLIKNDLYSEGEVSEMMGRSPTIIRKELENYQHYVEFSKFQKKKKLTQDPRKYTYFQRAGVAVRNKFFGTQTSREKFYGLITPDSKGITRIQSVSLKGGLMNFNTIAQNENILNDFLKDKKMSVQDALEIYKGETIQLSLPWLKKLKDVAKGLNQLGPEDIDKIKQDNTMINLIKKVYVGAKEVINNK